LVRSVSSVSRRARVATPQAGTGASSPGRRQDSCAPQYGYFRDALVTGKKWRTASGLRIGDPMRWIYRYHPRAKPTGTGGWWTLLERVPPWGDGTGYPALAAKVNRGSVSAFSVWFQAGGD